MQVPEVVQRLKSQAHELAVEFWKKTGKSSDKCPNCHKTISKGEDYSAAIEANLNCVKHLRGAARSFYAYFHLYLFTKSIHKIANLIASSYFIRVI
jgi:hypothetical protein